MGQVLVLELIFPVIQQSYVYLMFVKKKITSTNNQNKLIKKIYRQFFRCYATIDSQQYHKKLSLIKYELEINVSIFKKTDYSKFRLLYCYRSFAGQHKEMIRI